MKTIFLSFFLIISPMIAQTNLINNGSFEDGPNPGEFMVLSNGSTSISGWTVTRATIDYIGSFFPSAHGNRCLDLDGTPGNGGIKQSFVTTANKKYKVTFLMAGNPQCPPSVKKIRVRAANQSTVFEHGADLNWTKNTWEFTAKETRTTIEFYSVNNGGERCGPLLDNVKVLIEEDPLKQIKIGKLYVSYYGWELNQAILKGDLEKAKNELNKLKQENSQNINKIKEYDRQLELVNSNMTDIGEKIFSQYQQLNEVDDNLKNRRYKKIESSINLTNNRMIQITERVDYIKKNLSPIPDDAILKLVKEHETLNEKLSDEKNQLDILKERLGINKARQKKLDVIKKNEDLYWQYKRQIIDIEHNKSIASSLHGLSLERYTDANKRYDEAHLKYYKLKETGSPLITLIHNDYYYAQLWTPIIEIKKLDEQVGNFKNHLKKIDEIRTNLRNELFYNAEMVDHEAYQLTWAFYESALAQWGVEVAHFGYESYSAYKNGGFAGLAIKTAEKIVEETLSHIFFDGPTYYDAKYDYSDQFATKYVNGKKIVTENIVKTGGNYPFIISEAGNIGSIEWEIFETLTQAKKNLTQATRFREKNKDLIDNLSNLIDNQSKFLEKSEEAFRTSLGQGEYGKLKLGKKLAGNLVEGIVTDAGKIVLKKILAEEIEGKQLRDYMNAQYKLSGSARLLLQASNAYWVSKKEYDSLREFRNSVVEKYDPENQMKIEYSNTTSFSEEYKDYHIFLSDQNSDLSQASNREIDVFLGGVKAKRHPNGSLHFIIPADKISDIKSDEDGAFLEIMVIK